MADLAHFFGEDLTLGSTGDLLTVDGVDLSNQRIIRRLMTVMPDYIWQPEYGAGIPKQIGKTIDLAEITSIVTSQIFLEAAVASYPPPIITITELAARNGVTCTIRYMSAETGQQESLSFDVSK